MKNKYLLNFLTILSIVFFGSMNTMAQCDYISSTSARTDTLTYTFSGGSFASFGCAPIDPTYWLSGTGNTVQVTFVHAQSYPAIRVWGMNTDDVASVSVNGTSYPLTSMSAYYNPKVVCGLSPGPVGVMFLDGNLTGANSPAAGNYSYQDVTLVTTGVSTILITGLAGAGWGFAGVLVDCPLLSVESIETPSVNIFPNPTTGIIFFQGKMPEKAEVTILNDQGMVMKRLTPVNNEIDISGYSKGLYSLLIRFNDQVIVKRIIKD